MILARYKNGVHIILATVAAFVLYGIIHDQFTVRLSLEYFTIGHPKLINSQNPTLIALAWGGAATWWFGLLMGTLISACANVGNLPKLTVRDFIRPAMLLFAITGICAFIAAIIGYYLAQQRVLSLMPWYFLQLPDSYRVNFVAALWAHTASYTIGGIGSLILCAWTIRRRQILSKL